MADPSELNPNIKVRDLISAFEHQTSDQESNEYYEEDDIRPKLKRTKSVGSFLSYKLFRKPQSELYDILDIEKEIVKVETHLNYYEVYDKETHVAFQEQLFDILRNIVNIDTQGDPNTTQKKKQMIEDTQNLARILNAKLPVDGNLKKTAKKVYTVTVKKQEPVVLKHTKEFSKISHESHQKTVEKHDDTMISGHKPVIAKSENLNYPEKQEIIVSNEKIAPTDIDSGFLPSVKRLKSFFSFGKTTDSEEFHKIKSTNVSRSKSMLWKSKHSVERTVESDENLRNSELEEPKQGIGNEGDKIELQPHSNRVEPVPFEPIKEITSETEVIRSVSVNKLKKLFEEEKAETSQGLEIFSSSLPIKQNESGIAFTVMNLGAFRLKRSLSGQYMNQVGLLNRNRNTSKSFGDISSLARKDSLIINKFGNIENEIDDDDEEEEKMPSLDYNSGMPSIGYDINIPELIKEGEDDNKVQDQVSQSGFRQKEPAPKIGTEPVVEKTTSRTVAESQNTKKGKIGSKTHELIKILDSTKSFSTLSTSSVTELTSSASAHNEVQSSTSSETESQVAETSVRQQKTRVTRVTSHRVHNLVTSFERQTSNSDQNLPVASSPVKESSIPISSSPTSHHIVQNIISSIENKEVTGPTQIVEEPESLPFEADTGTTAEVKKMHDHNVTITEIPPILEVTENNLNKTPCFENSDNQELDIEPIDTASDNQHSTYINENVTEVSDSHNAVVSESFQNTSENGVSKLEHNISAEKHTLDHIGHTHTISNIAEVKENSIEPDKGHAVLSEKISENHFKHEIATNGDQESIKLANKVLEQQEKYSATNNSVSKEYINKLTDNYAEHFINTKVSEDSSFKRSDITKVTEKHTTTVVAKKKIIVDKSLDEDLFRDAVLDVENVDEEFEKLLSETIK